MPTIKVYHHGVTAGIAPMQNSHERAKRGVVQGWSKSAARNNTRWLRSVSPKSYSSDSEYGIAFTLTVRDCPESSDEWHRIRNAFIRRLRRDGMTKLHWVTEWQRRGVPHLHGVVFFPVGTACRIIWHWLALTSDLGAGIKGQHLNEVTDLSGWFKYLSKHASRGADHYQRSSVNIPKGWEKTGRVWGHCGDWVTTDAGPLNVTTEFFWAFRRIVRSWRKSDAREGYKKAKDQLLRKGSISTSIYKTSLRRITSSRTMLRCNERKKSSVRGVSEWIPSEHCLLVCDYLLSQGYEILTEESPSDAATPERENDALIGAGHHA